MKQWNVTQLQEQRSCVLSMVPFRILYQHLFLVIWLYASSVKHKCCHLELNSVLAVSPVATLNYMWLCPPFKQTHNTFCFVIENKKIKFPWSFQTSSVCVCLCEWLVQGKRKDNCKWRNCLYCQNLESWYVYFVTCSKDLFSADHLCPNIFGSLRTNVSSMAEPSDWVPRLCL